VRRARTCEPSLSKSTRISPRRPRAGTTRARVSSPFHGVLPASAAATSRGAGFLFRLRVRGGGFWRSGSPGSGVRLTAGHPLPSPGTRFERGARERPRAPRDSERLRSNERALARDARRLSADRDETRARPRVTRDPARQPGDPEWRLVRRPWATRHGARSTGADRPCLTAQARAWLRGGPSATGDRYLVSRRARESLARREPRHASARRDRLAADARTPAAEVGSKYLPARGAPPHEAGRAGRRTCRATGALFTRSGKDLR
jgi:hypothetical protein